MLGGDNNMKLRINMIPLGVRDLEKAIQFYAMGLGPPRMPFESGAAFFEGPDGIG